MAELTRREQQIYDKLVKGSVPKEIASDLNISNDTVLFHQKNIYRKLEVHSIHELIAQHHPEKTEPVKPKAEDHTKKSQSPNWRTLIAAGILLIVLLFVLAFRVNPNIPLVSENKPESLENTAKESDVLSEEPEAQISAEEPLKELASEPLSKLNK